MDLQTQRLQWIEAVKAIEAIESPTVKQLLFLEKAREVVANYAQEIAEREREQVGG